MKKLTVLFLAMISTFCYSQIKFEQGYYSGNNGEKKEILIRNLAWKNNPTEIEYKISENDASKKISIAEIREFGVGSNYKYKRYETKLDRSSNDVNSMSDSATPEWKSEILLLKVLVEGDATLYQYEDNNLVRYFFSQNDHQNADQLIYRQYLVKGAKIATTNQFRQQLFNALKSDNLKQSDFEKLQYTKNDLSNIFIEYNKTKDEFVDFNQMQNAGKLNLRIVLGAGSGLVNLNNDVNNVDLDFDSEISFKAGLEVEYVMPFNQNKWSLFLDPNFQSFKGETQNGTTKSNYEYTFVEIPIGVRHYFFLNEKSKIFINLGYAFAFNLDSYINYRGNEIEIQKSSNAFFGAGFRYDKFGIELRYNIKRNITSNYVFWNANINSIGISASYNFL